MSKSIFIHYSKIDSCVNHNGNSICGPYYILLASKINARKCVYSMAYHTTFNAIT